MIIDEKVVDVVKEIFNMYAEGHGSPDILNYLTNKKYVSPRGYQKTRVVQDDELGTVYHWNEATILAILRNEVYIGNTVQNKRSVISYKVKKVRNIDKENYIRVNDTHEAIIDKDLFATVQAIAEKRGSNSKLKYEYLLRGLLICHHCGRRLQIALKSNNRKQSVKRPYITCENHKERGCFPLNMNYNKFEESILNIIKQICKIYVSSDDLYEAYQNFDNKIIDLKQEMKKKADTISRTIIEIDNNLEKMYMDKLRGIISEENYIKYSEKMMQEKVNLFAQKDEIEREIKNQDSKKNSDYELDNIIKDFMKFENIDKNFLYKILDKIEIDKDKNVYLYFKFSKLNIIGQDGIFQKPQG